MAPPTLSRLIPAASPALCRLLDVARGPVLPPIRSEIFGALRFAQHGRSLGTTHRAARAGLRTATFVPRLRSNIRMLREAHAYIGLQASTGYDISPAGEWLLDNFHLIEAQLKEIHEGLPRRYFRSLPMLIDEPLAGLPRVYGVAWAFVAHTDGAFDDDLLVDFLRAYQDSRELNLSEMWALPTTLRVVLIENLRRLAERVATSKAARAAANLCCDELEGMDPGQLDRLLSLMERRGLSQVFLAQMAQRLQERRPSPGDADPTRHHDWLRRVLPDPAALLTRQSAEQAADNLSVSNAVTSLRAIGDADWPDLVARTSPLMQVMLTSPVFEGEDAATRDQTLHAIEQLARRSRRSEVAVARTLLGLMQAMAAPGSATEVAGHWLGGAGRPELARALGLPDHEPLRWRTRLRGALFPLYLGALLLGTAALVAWLSRHHPAPGSTPADSPWWQGLGVLLLVFPASEAVVAVMNRLIGESVRPDRLPRLALASGIPAAHRVLVVIPGLLSDPASTAQLVHRLEMHHLANPESQAQWALLTDWTDADTAQRPTDAALLADAQAQVLALNGRHAPMPPRADAPALLRFIVLHRERRFSPTEQRWIGWERKRGKLEQLLDALATGRDTSFIDLGELSRPAPGTPHLLTLDSDTQLPPGRLRELVGVAAHPHNQPRLSPDRHLVIGGYGILQPRVVTPLPALAELTRYHWLFAGRCGTDPYSAATSEVYQDLFGEGTFTGKGLLQVQAMHAVLSARLPEGQVLSHDLLEGSLARCAAVTDITLIEEAPFHADVAAARLHRWTRGDWQLLPFLLRPRRHRLRAVNRWKMFDNLRRSLVAPVSLLLLLMSLAGEVVDPWAALALVAAAFVSGPLMGAVAGLSPGREDLARRHFYRLGSTDLLRTVCGGLWHLGQLLQQSLQAGDAIVRAIYRTVISRRHLLQWTTSAAEQASARTGFAAALRRHRSEPVIALLLLGGLLWHGTPVPELATVLCLLWAASPVWTWWVSRPYLMRAAALPEPERGTLEGIARDTWRFFERCIGPDDHHLPPDNLQVMPGDMLAHRTSPTNIGLYLLSAACARQFGWIGTQDLLDRLEATLATLASLSRHRGHLLNWYDTQTCAPLLPMYVSTVDSGNLSGHLLAVAQACLELARAPADTGAIRRALGASARRLAPWSRRWSELLPTLPAGSALDRLVELADPPAFARLDPATFTGLLDEAGAELAALSALREAEVTVPPALPAARDELIWCLGDHLATLRTFWRDEQATTLAPASGEARMAARLQALARTCEQMAWQADFAFLYHPRRHLFHIGYRVAEQQLDAGFYDLLASESRLTSLLAIAKGDVPVSHWASLGRPFYAVGVHAGLRSWSGSMFEYLMPTLVLAEPHGSVLHDACCAALREQIGFAQAQHVPWGISESAYAGRDHTLAYQYAPQGVPRLALRRTPPDELVIAPYATALAAQVDAHRAVGNFLALTALAGRGRYGFIEALDFTPVRQVDAGVVTPVGTFMAHHQGMSLVALANVLLDGVARRWGMANAHIEAVSSLLQERVPREVSVLSAPPAGPPVQVLQQRTPGMLREVRPGATALAPTHLLSNGRYSVSLRANGAGWSRWGTAGITRWRDDALRDAHGSFFYLRRDRQAQLVSITQHPAPDPEADYQSTFHADRVSLDASWPDLQSSMTVWVSPEDDIEFRQVELRNLGDQVLDIELISTFDVTLTDPRADEAHPAFTNLFVRARWLASAQALVFERRPRLVTERGLHAAHFLADTDPQVVGLRLQTDRQRWLGRNRLASQPLGELAVAPAHDRLLDTGLDPVCALAVRLRILPGSKARLTLATAVCDDGGTLAAVIDKYRQPRHVQRASLMSATLTGIRLRALNIGAEQFACVQTLSTALLFSLSRPSTGADRADGQGVPVRDRRLLWRLGISGDRPIVVVTAGMPQGLGLMRSMVQALRLWSWGGVACDLVVINAEPASYHQGLHREIAALRERYQADTGTGTGPAGAALSSFHLLRADELSADELSTLHGLARLSLQADGRPLLHHVQAWIEQHEEAFERRHDLSTSPVPTPRGPAVAVPAPVGSFADGSGEFGFEVGMTCRPPRPWINVLSNPDFGAQLSESAGGCTWAVNSRMNQLTAWSNDPVADPPSEWFLLQDTRSMEVWSLGASAWGRAGTGYRVVHGPGRSQISHRHGELEVCVTWCVDPQLAVKQVRVQLMHRGARALHLRLVGLAEWMMGAHRSDRSTVSTALYRPALPANPLTALLCTQHERSAGFGDGTAFLALLGGDDEHDWTCDRRECLDARGRLVLPDHFGQSEGEGLDPCAALSTRLLLRPGERAERVFLLGHAHSPQAARQLVVRAGATAPERRLEQVAAHWDRLLGATTVRTPDPLFDVMVNRWLLYQAVSCRLWAKAGFYQAGGATGFRDQLQDAMALAWAEPAMLRAQILRCASRQFVEGDVQHWWHLPGGAGVRTHFSDDLLWLAHACVHHLRVTGDRTLLDERVPFIEGVTIPEGAEDAYATPSVSAEQATVYEHAARAIDRSLRVGAHGLPLMGSGDWNDGMNRVGHEGRGESVWLGWFLCQLVADFAPLARERGESDRARRWTEAAEGWTTALLGPAWDGQWFRRAFFDGGQTLGSQADAEARIDLIAQAWAVLSGVAPPAMQGMALAAVEAHLLDPVAGLVRLLDPPLAHAVPSAGYIQAYPPGVRENGGQYSHAGAWTVMALARHAQTLADPRAATDLAYRCFTWLSPAHRAAHPAQRAVYGIEPYVMAGDVCSQPPFTGRGGWSWYTGAAAWMHRAAVESILGLQLEAHRLRFHPCLPSHWPQAELTLRRDGRTMRFLLLRGPTLRAVEALVPADTRLLWPGEWLAWVDLPPQSTLLIPLLHDTPIR
ncbi:cyclic beta-1,2-glucan synthetase [Sphaerotilus hippei]|uniref:Cyclic beta-1,2-glucan synthetase n=1 Tax=Sphaerotilus hippei TaxID=744406 RepID=A0A318H018_9BURK|nr:glucoamylase family protein [Sphaerotilus hippei]PXW94426.1 cyclic beta-1,2-glucan synthetase [Sphaerotilus hippei]